MVTRHRSWITSGLMALLLLFAALHGGALSPATAADFDKGLAAYKAGDYQTALAEWRPLAEAGDVNAQTMLGLVYAEGKGVPQEHAEAAKWFRRAATRGHAEAQFALGVLYGLGEGVPQDFIAAHM
jgi:TPR repeat protein|tara:strand:- start:372 stop:749 length:378 start_codon:yes stop_codon:yes gene_type:complete